MNMAHWLVATTLLLVSAGAGAEEQRGTARGFTGQEEKPYPSSNWTSYTFKDRGQTVRYDGGVDDVTGFVKRMSIDYGHGAQVHVERPQPAHLGLVGGIKITSTSAVTMSAAEAAKDFVQILNDQREQNRAYDDLKRLIAGRRGEQLAETVALKSISSMKDFALELQKHVNRTAPPDVEPRHQGSGQ
jgi:hypothetical protein